MRAAALVLVSSAMALAGCVDSGIVCNAPHTSCKANEGTSQLVCADLRSDPAHCGSCNVACSAGEACVCADEACATSKCECPPNTIACGGACVDVQTDAKNCGACGKPCGDVEHCQAASCVSACGTGKTGCGNSCVDLTADPLHCGGCATTCPQGQSCVASHCQSTVVAACFNTGLLIALDDNLIAQASSLAVGGGPQSLAVSSGRVLVADTIDAALYRVDASKAPPAKDAAGDKLGMAVNQVLVHGGKAFSINSMDNNVQVIDLSKAAPTAIDTSRTVDQVPTFLSGSSAANTNPYLGAFVGDKLYVTLLGSCYPDPAAGEAAGNRILEIDTATTPAQVKRELVFSASSFDKDSGAAANSPRPSGIASVGSKLFVAIGNLTPDCANAAGPGYLAVVDTAADPMTLHTIKLPQDCRNTGFVLASADRVYVSCLGNITNWAYDGVGASLVVLDPTTELALATTSFPRCAASAPSSCRTAVPGRLTLRPSGLLIADSNAGRLFVTDRDGAVPAGREQGVSLCAPSASGYQLTSDVLSLR